jgi:phosphate:Na+ symporter
VEKDLLAIVGKRRRKNLAISESTATELRALATAVSRAFDDALKALESGDADDALEVLESKKSVSALAEEATAHIAKRLIADEPNRLDNFQVETEIIETYKRFNTLTRRIARLAVQARETGADTSNRS